MAKKQKGAGTRKYDRNRKWCEAYRARGQRERNLIVRMQKRLKTHPNDKSALEALRCARLVIEAKRSVATRLAA